VGFKFVVIYDTGTSHEAQNHIFVVNSRRPYSTKLSLLQCLRQKYFEQWTIRFIFWKV